MTIKSTASLGSLTRLRLARMGQDHSPQVVASVVHRYLGGNARLGASAVGSEGLS